MQRIYHNIDTPDSSKSWSVVQKHLDKKNRLIKRIHMLKVSGFIIVCSLLMNFFIMTTFPVVHSQVSGLLKKVTDNFIEIFLHQPKEQSSDKAKTPPPPDWSNNEIESNGTSLQEAKENVDFKLFVPGYIPVSFELDTVRLFGNSEKINNVYIKYANAEGEIISILQKKIEAESTDIKTMMAVGSGHYKEITINGNDALLIIADKGNPILEWITQDYVLIRISGKLTEAEITTIASSLN